MIQATISGERQVDFVEMPDPRPKGGLGSRESARIRLLHGVQSLPRRKDKLQDGPRGGRRDRRGGRTLSRRSWGSRRHLTPVSLRAVCLLHVGRLHLL